MRHLAYSYTHCPKTKQLKVNLMFIVPCIIVITEE